MTIRNIIPISNNRTSNINKKSKENNNNSNHKPLSGNGSCSGFAFRLNNYWFTGQALGFRGLGFRVGPHVDKVIGVKVSIRVHQSAWCGRQWN